MKSLILVLVLVVAVEVPQAGRATVPGNPSAIVGIDRISPSALGNVLARFCAANGCTLRLLDSGHDDFFWNLVLDNHRPVDVSSGCPFIHHRYCVQTWGQMGKAFMSPARTQQLKRMLEAKGATVVLMDCSVEQTEHGLDYVCADGKPPK